MLFVRFSLSSFRWWRSLGASSSSPFSALASLFCVPALALWLAVGLLLCPLWLAGLLVRSALFVRFRRPVGCPPFGASVARWCRFAGLPCGWRCVSASALPVVRSRFWVWAVRPAVVRRRSGVVCFFWVWVSPPAGGADPEEATP